MDDASLVVAWALCLVRVFPRGDLFGFQRTGDLERRDSHGKAVVGGAAGGRLGGVFERIGFELEIVIVGPWRRGDDAIEHLFELRFSGVVVPGV